MVMAMIAVRQNPVMNSQAEEGHRTQENENFGNIEVSHYVPLVWIIRPYRMDAYRQSNDSSRKIGQEAGG